HTRFSRDWSSDVCSSDWITASPSGPANTASGGSWSATSGGTGVPSGTYGGLQTTTATWPTRSPSAAGSVASAATTVTGRSPAAARAAAFRRNQTNAASDRSTATTRAAGHRWAISNASAPLPLARSTTTGSPGSVATSRLAQPASNSVSGRGTNTPGPTANSRCPNPAVPVRCWSGTRCARAATNWRYRRLAASSQSGISTSWARDTPSTCAASSSASTLGDATPAAANTRAASATSAVPDF